MKWQILRNQLLRYSPYRTFRTLYRCLHLTPHSWARQSPSWNPKMTKKVFRVVKKPQLVIQFLLLMPNPSISKLLYRIHLSISSISTQISFIPQVNASICYAQILTAKIIFRFIWFVKLQLRKFVILAIFLQKDQNTMGYFQCDLPVDAHCWLSKGVCHTKVHNKWLLHSKHRTLNCIFVLWVIVAPYKKEFRG